MLKKILAVTALLFSLSSFAAVDVNKANAADLDGIKGIGPSLSGKILKERNKGQFKDWPDLMHRVSGMGEKNSAKLSAQGLTVNGADYKGSGASQTAKVKPNEKPADKNADKTGDKSKSAKS
jgi:competence protein ComEA